MVVAVCGLVMGLCIGTDGPGMGLLIAVFGLVIGLLTSFDCGMGLVMGQCVCYSVIFVCFHLADGLVMNLVL